MERPKSGTPDKRDSWSAEDIGSALDTFRPVTITISSFFKQVMPFSSYTMVGLVILSASLCNRLFAGLLLG